MVLQPPDLTSLCRALAEANARREKISRIDLRAFRRVLEHHPEDMTVTVETGLTLSELQESLARHRQWLPLDPPGADCLTIADVILCNASGPRRCGYGPIRDYVLGLRAVLADGRLVYSGGKVVKNVAGYDLAKLFIGSRGTLGPVVEVTLKLRPLPEMEEFLSTRFANLDAAAVFLDRLETAALSPVVLDLHNVFGPPNPSPIECELVLGFAGTREEVTWQIEEIRALGSLAKCPLDHERRFWESPPTPYRVSVLPSDLIGTLRNLGPVSFVARVANGLIFYRGSPEPQKTSTPHPLHSRIKDAFDPNHIFPAPL
jgi:FAD/FMN-containing dehydrogenase